MKISFLFIFIILLSPLKDFAQFVKGADIGWLSQMESDGYAFHDTTGIQAECLDILQSRQINTARLRVWVNPSDDKINGHCNKKEVADMALRAKNLGMRLMIDFHYSDSWADPGKQTKPAAWSSHDFSQLLKDVYDHTYDILDTLKSIGATPAWVQIGNEISGGMLWPDGSTSNWSQLARLLNKGYDAAKAVDSTIKVVIHLNNGHDNSLFRWFFDNAINQGVNFDIIGMSYYPYWEGHDYTATINELGNNLNDMASRYGKEVIVAETGGVYDQVQTTYDMLVAVIKKVAAVPGKKGLGVIYWEPEGEKSWSGYSLSCWQAGGMPTRALNAFLYDVTTGEDEIINNVDIKIYPNPSPDGRFSVDLTGSYGSSVIRIITADGRLMSEQMVQNQAVIDLSTRLEAGIYFLQVTNPGQTCIQKLIIQ